MNVSQRFLALLVVAAWSAAAAVAGVPLRYRCEIGSSQEFTIENDFQLPLLGAQPSKVVVRSTVVGHEDGGTRVRQTIDRTRPNVPARTIETGMHVTPTGEISGQTELPADSEGVFLARTTLLLLPVLPDRVVQAGSTWSADRTVPLPPMKISAPPQVRVKIDYTVESVAGGKVEVAMTAKSLPGEGLTLTHTGHLTLDAATGRPLAGNIDGQGTLSVFLMGSMTASFKIRLVSSVQHTAPALAGGPRISLLNVE